jgi:lipopolysaccharide biosynthesis glycosyltransferase
MDPLNINILTLPDHKVIIENFLERYFAELSWTVIELNVDMKRFPEGSNIIGYLRLLIPEISCFSKVLYLDADTLIKTDLRELWQISLEDFLFGAMLDCNFPTFVPQGCSESSLYFNSGVLLMNVLNMKKIDFTNQVLNYLVQNRNKMRFQFGDQDAMNYLFHKDWKMVHCKWNVLSHLTLPDMIRIAIREVKHNTIQIQMQEAIENPAIIHFAGEHSPWIFGTRTLFSNDWHSYRKEFMADEDFFSYQRTCVEKKIRQKVKIINLDSKNMALCLENILKSYRSSI